MSIVKKYRHTCTILMLVNMILSLLAAVVLLILGILLIVFNDSIIDQIATENAANVHTLLPETINFVGVLLIICAVASIVAGVLMYLWFKKIETAAISSYAPGVVAIVLGFTGIGSLFALIVGIIWCVEFKNDDNVQVKNSAETVVNVPENDTKMKKNSVKRVDTVKKSISPLKTTKISTKK
ncbi:MAG: hypothetical protein LBH55_00420 [Mycoplasmataceae bacterium]|nr:hypothetical protein [Mycoplasmataceae bacterium]